jgi:tRNA modification GTPase
MLPDLSDTIAALATPSGPGGLSVIRLSGRNCIRIADKIIKKGSDENITNPRLMLLVKLIDEKDQQIDQALVVYFKAPASYTGEDMFEFQCHGGEYISHKVIETCVKYGARRAQPGEFTMRAFLNGRIDLTQAEGILALVSSGAAPTHLRALNLLSGTLKERINHIRDHLMELITPFEAIIDHPEDDLDNAGQKIDYEIIEHIKHDIFDLALGYRETPSLDAGLKLALVGKPNVGKSSLMNKLLMKRRVLVHDSPGTTRDVVSEDIVLGEGRFRIFDTAGLRYGAEDLEAEGIILAREAISEADACVVVLDISSKLTGDDFEILDMVKGRPCIVCLNKTDLVHAWSSDNYPDYLGGKIAVEISCKTEKGIDNLLAEMKHLYLENIGEIKSQVPLLKRHHGHLMRASEALSDAQSAVEMILAPDIISIDLRNALQEILSITGEYYDDVLLEEIFSNFCVGK